MALSQTESFISPNHVSTLVRPWTCDEGLLNCELGWQSSFTKDCRQCLIPRWHFHPIKRGCPWFEHFVVPMSWMGWESPAPKIEPEDVLDTAIDLHPIQFLCHGSALMEVQLKTWPSTYSTMSMVSSKTWQFLSADSILKWADPEHEDGSTNVINSTTMVRSIPQSDGGCPSFLSSCFNETRLWRDLVVVSSSTK